MQQILPLFASDFTMINPNLGYKKTDGFVYYQLHGLPVYHHKESDLHSFRFITSNLVIENHCTRQEIAEAFGVSYDSVKQNATKLSEEGIEKFFLDKRKGHSYKLIGEVLERIQYKLYQGKSNAEIAREEGVTEGSIRAAIKTGKLKKKDLRQVEPTQPASNRSERSALDKTCPMGIGASNETERLQAALGQIAQANTEFVAAQSVCRAGVLLLLPALLAQGLLKTNEVYNKLSAGYYSLQHIVLLLSFMALSRIKNPEQTKMLNPGEFGKIIGLDRIPEVTCLRKKVTEITDQNQAEKLGTQLAIHWISMDNVMVGFYYVDGHVRIYNGYHANLPKCYVSRQKLCMPASIDWYVNDWKGLPYFVTTGVLNEKMIDVLKTQIIPRLIDDIKAGTPPEIMNLSKNTPLFTLVFDREGYSLPFFDYLWTEYKIAVISYRKNVTDKWDETLFKEVIVNVAGKEEKMKLAEQIIKTDESTGFVLTEVRKLTETSHQTAIYSTNPQIICNQIAGGMFSRWSQENYFHYMSVDYGIDDLYEYKVKEVDTKTKIVNPHYKTLEKQLIKTRALLRKKRADLTRSYEVSLDKNIEETEAIKNIKIALYEQIEELRLKEREQFNQRKQTEKHISLELIPKEERYGALTTEKKMFMESIKMIAYRAETAMVNLLDGFFKRNEEEGRMLIKQIIASDADLMPDYENNTLTVTVHTLSTPRANNALRMLCDVLNETETIFPATTLRLIFRLIGC